MRLPWGRAGLRITAAALAMAGAGALAQGLDFASKGDAPIEVLADQGIEWQQETRRLIARGNARAIRSNVTVHGDVLTADYREKAGGGTEIWRLAATGNVRIVSPNETVYGDTAEYDVDTASVRVKGQPARLVTPKEVITARDSLEYHEVERKAMARGDAVAITSEGRRLRADLLTAHLTPREGEGVKPAAEPQKNAPAPAPTPPSPPIGKDNPSARLVGNQGESKVQLINADGNVVIDTPNEVVHGDAGTYTVETGIATITGSVKITRGENQLNGGYAVVNLKTGISKLYASPPGKMEQDRVKLLLVPERKSGGGKTGKSAPARQGDAPDAPR